MKREEQYEFSNAYTRGEPVTFVKIANRYMRRILNG
jgi:hypothetical protein